MRLVDEVSFTRRACTTLSVRVLDLGRCERIHDRKYHPVCAQIVARVSKAVASAVRTGQRRSPLLSARLQPRGQHQVTHPTTVKDSRVSSTSLPVPDLRALFRQESVELLALAERAILVLEQNPSEAESCNELFRAIHTVKSSAGLSVSVR